MGNWHKHRVGKLLSVVEKAEDKVREDLWTAVSVDLKQI